nr:retrovirus-related Pol polyprotein from transposon TNT 1-94 [Tanacetum cinerariifolium]
SILTDSKVTPTKYGRITKLYSSSKFIDNCFISGIYKDECGGRSSLLLNGTILFHRRSLRFRERLGSNNGLTSSELEARKVQCTSCDESYSKLGHPAEPVLNVLKESLQFDNKDQNVYCEIFQRAKQTRKPFPLSDHTSKFLVNNSGNDADNSEDIFVAQNEEVATLDENVFPEGDLNQNPTTSAEEMDALLRNDTWDIVYFPKDIKAIGSKWIFKIKYRSSGEIDRYKARLVVQGFGQKEGIEYEETFSPVVKMGLETNNLLPVALHCDSNSAIKIAANPVFYERPKYLKIDLHFVRGNFLKGVVKTVKVESANQTVDILTKGLDTVQHKELVKKLKMFDIYQVEAKGVSLI